MASGHVRTIQEVTPALGASGGFVGQKTDARFYTADAGSPLGPAGWLANVFTITATPAQACKVLVEGGYISDEESPWVMSQSPGYVVPSLPAYDPWVWQPLGTVNFNAGQLVSQSFRIEPYRWLRVSLSNGVTAVTIQEDFSDQ